MTVSRAGLAGIHGPYPRRLSKTSKHLHANSNSSELFSTVHKEGSSANDSIQGGMGRYTWSLSSTPKSSPADAIVGLSKSAGGAAPLHS